MILRSDITSAGKQIRTRNVVSTVTKLHLGRLCTGSTSEKLMPQANAKDGRPRFVNRSAYVSYCVLHHGRITRSIGNEQAIIVLAGQLWKVVVPRHDQDLYAAFHQTTELVKLEADIYTDYAHRPTRRVLQSSRRVRGV